EELARADFEADAVDGVALRLLVALDELLDADHWMNVARMTYTALSRVRSGAPCEFSLEAARIGGIEMSTIWSLLEACFSDARRADELVRTPAARRGEAKLDAFLTRSMANEALDRGSGAAPAMTLMDRFFLDLFPLARAVHVRSESSVHDQHDEARDRR